jgi:hypothetical protein
MTESRKIVNCLFPSFRRTPESSPFKVLQKTWTPFLARLGGFNGVTTFYEAVMNSGQMLFKGGR